VLTYLSRAFWEALRHRYRAWAKSRGLPDPRRAETGAVTGVHRAGLSLNLHVHFHTLCADGVYVEDDTGALRFVQATPPTRAELEAMLARIAQRVMKCLKTRGLLRGRRLARGTRAILVRSPRAGCDAAWQARHRRE
jgi:hypothetical protein